MIARAEPAIRRCYVYGVVPGDVALPEDVPGLGTGRVELVRHAAVAAVVGEVAAARPLGSRDDLLGHERVLEALVAAGTPVLPLRFGAVLTDPASVAAELLAPHHDYFLGVLERLTGHTEFTLTGRYQEEPVLRQIVAANPEIRQLREETMALPPGLGYDQRMRLGALVVSALGRMREADAPMLLVDLAPHAVSMVVREPRDADVVVDAAFLVADEHRGVFEHHVEDLGANLAGRVRLRLVGPLPAYDFVPPRADGESRADWS